MSNPAHTSLVKCDTMFQFLQVITHLAVEGVSYQGNANTLKVFIA